MARAASEITVTQPLLDRLIDREPQRPADAVSTRAQSVRQLRAAVRRDLEWLLNSRRTPEPAPESLPELSRSVFNYGLPDFSALTIDSPRDRDYLLIELENTLAIFEPRLKDVRVTLLETPNSAAGARVLHFQIEGLLQMDPAPEQVAFDTLLQLSSGDYQIRGERGA